MEGSAPGSGPPWHHQMLGRRQPLVFQRSRGTPEIVDVGAERDPLPAGIELIRGKHRN